MFPDKVSVDIDYEPNLDSDEFLKQYDIIHYHRAIGPFEKTEELLKRLDNLGIVSIMDIDDYWELGQHHPSHLLVKKNGLDKKILNNIKCARNVTTTTDIFANEILKYNKYKSVHVLPNAIDPNEKQYIPNPEKSDRIRIAWLGGSSHLHDLKLLEGVVGQIKRDGLIDKVQFVLCGFDLRGTITFIDQNTKEQKTRAIQPKESVWYQYEQIFTDNYNIVSPEYKDFLLKFKNEEYHNVANEPYRRVWTKPISSYATNYNLFDVALAPIEEHIFNKCKCIVGDSLVSTTDGIKHICDIVENKLKLKTELDNNTNDVVNYFKYENTPTIKITTNDGFTIEGTPHHKIYIDNKWVELKDLRVNDKIELTQPNILQTKYQELTYPMLTTKNITEEKINYCDESMLPRIVINKNWGRLIGYLIGDGHFSKNGVAISCDKRHKNVVNDVVNLYKSIGLNPLIRNKQVDKRCKTSQIKEGNGVDIVSTCVNFASIIRKYGLKDKNGKVLEIPKFILNSPKSVIKEFIKGLFEADGTVDNNGIVSFCSKSEKLVKQLQIILLSFNIQTNLSKRYNKQYKKYYFYLNLKREGSENYLKEIGFISEHKQDRLEQLNDSKRSNNFKPQTMTDLISSIEHLTNTVYDIEVDLVHEYNANGIKNHNSQLKVIESGFHKKALIAQDFGPYQIDLVNAYEKGGVINMNGNSLLVSKEKNHKDWYKHIKRVIENPEIISTLSENLHNKVKDLYSIQSVCEKRMYLYEQLHEKIKNKQYENV